MPTDIIKLYNWLNWNEIKKKRIQGKKVKRNEYWQTLSVEADLPFYGITWGELVALHLQ